MSVECWVQHADYDSDEFGEVDLKKALMLWRGHDWDQALRDFNALEADGTDCCPPGIGFTRSMTPSAEFLHVCPAAGNVWTIYYQHPDRNDESSLMVEGMTSKAIEKAMAAFFAGGRVGIETELGRYAA